MEGREQEQENQSERHGNDNQKPLRGRLEMLELTAPVEDISRRPLHLGLDGLLRLAHKTSDIAAPHVHSHDRPPLNVLALDFTGTFLEGQIRQTPQGDRPSLRVHNPDRLDPLGIVAPRWRQTHLDRKSGVFLEAGSRGRITQKRSHGRSPQRGNDVENVRRLDSVARQLVTLHQNFQHR